MRKAQGFTVVEVILVIVVLVAAGLIFWHEKSVVDAKNRDLTRKTAINAIAYSLDNVYHVKHGYYPDSLNDKTFMVIDPAIMRDPRGHAVGDKDSDYRYEPTNCAGGQCQGYSLRAQLEYEADYVKSSDDHASD
ncbi:MAG TPA: hypothetical protein VFG56_00165 [Candidatus Saccharimonadales bacterium]|nr:hypothetical protein [Candidatus Saccharimonadales bacterium]